MDAYDAGYDAYWDGVDLADNPHDQETEADAAVILGTGLAQAREHDYDESEGWTNGQAWPTLPSASNRFHDRWFPA